MSDKIIKSLNDFKSAVENSISTQQYQINCQCKLCGSPVAFKFNPIPVKQTLIGTCPSCKIRNTITVLPLE